MIGSGGRDRSIPWGDLFAEAGSVRCLKTQNGNLPAAVILRTSRKSPVVGGEVSKRSSATQPEAGSDPTEAFCLPGQAYPCLVSHGHEAAPASSRLPRASRRLSPEEKEELPEDMAAVRWCLWNGQTDMAIDLIDRRFRDLKADAQGGSVIVPAQGGLLNLCTSIQRSQGSITNHGQDIATGRGSPRPLPRRASAMSSQGGGSRSSRIEEGPIQGPCDSGSSMRRASGFLRIGCRGGLRRWVHPRP
jgi:hypothetical protein